MTRQVQLLTIKLVIEIDADDADALGNVDGILAPLGESQTPMPGIRDLSYRIVDSCIQSAFKLLHIAGIKSILEDGSYELSEPQDEKHPDDWFY